MLTFRQLDDLPRAVEEIIASTEQAIVNDMARRIAKMGGITDASQWQLLRLEAMGATRDFVLKEMGKALELSEKALIQMFDEAATRALAADDKIYRAAGYNPTPLAEDWYMQQTIRAGIVKTLGTYRNLTNTTANTATQQFEQVLDLSYSMIKSGAFSYQQAIRAGILDLSRKGIAAITYPTGWVDYLDVAFRRATLTGVNQTCAELQFQRMNELGTDLVETTAHHGARPDHTVWQGRWFSLSGLSDKYPNFYSATGYGTGPGLCGWNCRHSFFPVIEGLSNHEYSYDKLRDFNNRTVNYNGDDMSLYDATQQQRHIERNIRKWKREANAMDAAGLNNHRATHKVREWQARQRDFINQTGLSRDYFRERAGAQNLETSPKSDIIKVQLRNAGVTGQINLPPRSIDVDNLGFDDQHINVERGHGVTEQQAKGFIQNAKISTTKWNGTRENYYGYDGVSYVDLLNHEIRTAFKSEEFDATTLKIIEVLRKNGK
ncbi:MAG: phage minor capsid protein [Christensenella sp.]